MKLHQSHQRAMDYKLNKYESNLSKSDTYAYVSKSAQNLAGTSQVQRPQLQGSRAINFLQFEPHMTQEQEKLVLGLIGQQRKTTEK